MTPGALPRILTLMGSGETSPTMVKVHRSILERLGPRPVPAVLLDTPFGFQENASELTARVRNYFQESLQTDIVNASGIDPEDPSSQDPRFVDEQLTANIQRARYIFSGPGSPTYALRKWEHTVVPRLLQEKLRDGGAITFASAAALTLGALTTPVYEIYKVGDDPRWLPGLDIVAEAGLHVAVIPHFNNAEGGTHDTRFCYLGERRLRELEAQMSDDIFVLGIDEHTSCTIDLDSRSVTVGGIGVVTVRKHGQTTTFATGTTIDVDELIDAAHTGPGAARHATQIKISEPDQPPTQVLLLDTVKSSEESFHVALEANDALSAAAAILNLEQEIHNWSSDAPGQDEMARARASLRSMITHFGQTAVQGLAGPWEQIAPFTNLLVALRNRARTNRRFDEADDIRNSLAKLGIELRDGANGTTWVNKDGA